MKALAHPARLMLIDQLEAGERCICELQPLFPQDKSTLSRHVAALRNAGIVRERRDGVRVYLIAGHTVHPEHLRLCVRRA
jgi:DNA-binding transcriptional ArsR family regulator